MKNKNQRIIFTTEDNNLTGVHTIEISDKLEYKIEVLNIIEIEKLIDNEDIKDLNITKINPLKLESNTLEISFSALTYFYDGNSEYWISSKDELGKQVYQLNGDCWKLKN